MKNLVYVFLYDTMEPLLNYIKEDAMKPEDGNVLKIFKADVQFIVPLYQRMYSWKEDQCKKLWDDIVFLEKNNKNSHFMGSIVSIIESTSTFSTSKYMVIDGQQRLTTLTILLIALRDYLTSKGIPSSITKNLLTNETNNVCLLYTSPSPRDA